MSLTKLSIVFFLLGISVLTSCSKKMSVQEFLDHVNKDEDFVKTYAGPDFKVTCIYKPAELMALTELRGEFERNGKISQERFNSVKADFSDASYFLLKVGLTNGEDILQSGVRSREEYARRVNDITFNMGRSAFILNSEKDTIRATIFDLQRSYGMSPDLTVLFAFPAEKVSGTAADKIDFVYADPYFGIPQKVILSYHPEELRKKLPEINLNGYE